MILVGLALGLVAASAPRAHPTPEALRQASEERARCERPPEDSVPVDAGRIAMSLKALRAAVPELAPDAAGESPTVDSGSDLLQLSRAAGEGLSRVEYDLWQGRVYRIRWRLAERFERPVMDELARVGRICLGRPEYDQTIEAEPGSPVATLRRVGWRHDERRIELRQLHPLGGGPVYLSVTHAPTLREMGASGRPPPPEPDRTGAWWKRPTKRPRPVTDEERAALGRAFLDLLAQLDH